MDLDPLPTTEVTIKFALGEGTATPGSDFNIGQRSDYSTFLTYSPTTRSGTMTVPAGVNGPHIAVCLIHDSVHERDETIVLTLVEGSGYRLTSPATRTVTIVDDDGPHVSFASASGSAVEGSGTHNVQVTLDKAPTFDLTLAYTVTGTATAGLDYTALTGTVTALARATTATIPVTVADDSVRGAARRSS